MMIGSSGSAGCLVEAALLQTNGRKAIRAAANACLKDCFSRQAQKAARKEAEGE